MFETLPGNDGEMRRGHASSHEEDDVLVARLSVVHHLLLEELQVVLVVSVDLQESDGHLSVPAAAMDPTPATLPDELAEIQLLEGNVPLLQVDAGLTGLTRDGTFPVGSSSRAGQVVQLVSFTLSF